MSDRYDWRELAAGYALDALDDSDRRQLEAHLADSATARAEVEELRAIAGLLAHAVPVAEPSPELRDRVLAAVRAVTQPAGEGAPARDRREPGSDEPAPHELAGRDDRHRGIAPGWLLLAASLLVAVGVGYWSERTSRIALQGGLDELRQDLADSQQQVAQRDRLIDALSGSDIMTASLAATGAEPSVRVFWNRTQGVAVVTAFNLPPAAADRTYQLWGIDTAGAGTPISLGTFDTAANQRAAFTVIMPAGATFDVAAVTDEPAGGSAQPTTQPFLVGTFAGN